MIEIGGGQHSVTVGRLQHHLDCALPFCLINNFLRARCEAHAVHVYT